MKRLKTDDKHMAIPPSRTFPSLDNWLILSVWREAARTWRPSRGTRRCAPRPCRLSGRTVAPPPGAPAATGSTSGLKNDTHVLLGLGQLIN